MIPAMTEEELRQILLDAGCDDQTIGCYLAAARSDDGRGCSRLLEGRRRILLEGIHAEEKKLTCLDYLRYQLKRTERSKKL